MADARDPVADLRAIAFLLERAREPTYRVKAFRTAADVVDELPADELAERAAAGTLQELTGIGEVDRAVHRRVAARARCRSTCAGCEATEDDAPLRPTATAAIRAALRGDCHTHSDWSDGGSPIARWPRPRARSGTSTSCSPTTRRG